MTIFSRRRLQSMLDELAPILDDRKRKDLLARLNHKKKEDQALPAEMELALLWAIHSLGEMEVEPEWWGDSKRPDAVTDFLVQGRTAAIEIAATNDNSLSGEADMDAIAQQIGEVANRAKAGVGDYLSYRFGETSGYESGKYYRRRLAPKAFQLDENQRAGIAGWVASGQSTSIGLRVQAEGLDVVIEHKSYKQTRFHNISSSMPAEAHSLDDNPLFELLKRKKRQLKAAAQGTLRILFVADVGSSLLNRMGRMGWSDPMGRTVSGDQIIRHFIDTYAHDVDAVVVFSPTIERSAWLGSDPTGRKPKRWSVAMFGANALPQIPEALDRIAAILPAPHYEGYQARSLFRQGAFSPDKHGRYLGMTVTTNRKDNRHRIHFPARLLVDLLAGRITEEWFQNYHTSGGRNANLFAHWLNMGMTLSGAEMAPRNVDEDDDHIILHFSDDPAARPFKFQGTE
ncbi:MAG: hypothetical protein KGL44_03215 [Sphingomonadales bacterium]|nr:hypothetical protein [Sphingomonadales bacterium]